MNTENAWVRAFRDLPREHGFEPLRVEGTLPDDLAGTFYKNGAGLFDRFGERCGHWFDADGAVTAVRLGGGRAHGGVRLVRTAALEREERAGRRLFGGYNTPFRRPLREMILRDSKNPANTSMMVWQDRLFALCEAGRPYEIDRADLGTGGERDFSGVLKRAFSAHPHDVPARRAIYGFGLVNGPDARVVAYELPYAGRARRVAEFGIRGPTMVHDFAATARHLIFFIAPMRIKALPAMIQRKGGMDAMGWHSTEGTEIVIVPIDDPARIVRFTADAFLCEHVANAFEEGRTIQVDFIRYADMRALDDYVGGLVHGVVRARLESTVCRAIIDLDARDVRFESRLAAPCELPRVSPRVEGTSHQFVYLAGFSTDRAAETGFFDAVLKLDTRTGAAQKYLFSPGQYASEALFIPRRGASAEDDGYLLTMIYDAPSDSSHLAVLDARTSGAPVARAWFDHAIPPGFHAAWTS